VPAVLDLDDLGHTLLRRRHRRLGRGGSRSRHRQPGHGGQASDYPTPPEQPGAGGLDLLHKGLL